MSIRKRRKFTKEFKEQIVRLVSEGRTVASLAREHELPRSAVNVWLEKAKVGATGAKAKVLSSSERDELQELRREVRQLKMEREILKRATAFFAKETTT